MNKEKEIELTIETPAIGNVLVKVGHSLYEGDDELVIGVPRGGMPQMMYVDLTHVVKDDIERFIELNKRSDERHQIYIDTLTVYGVKISGNYLRVQYWFHQDGNENIRRMCAGEMVHCFCDYYKHYATGEKFVVLPEGYSGDVCVYW